MKSARKDVIKLCKQLLKKNNISFHRMYSEPTPAIGMPQEFEGKRIKFWGTFAYKSMGRDVLTQLNMDALRHGLEFKEKFSHENLASSLLVYRLILSENGVTKLKRFDGVVTIHTKDGMVSNDDGPAIIIEKLPATNSAREDGVVVLKQWIFGGKEYNNIIEYGGAAGWSYEKIASHVLEHGSSLN